MKSGEKSGAINGTKNRSLRIPLDLDARLIEVARREKRSVHGQMLHFIERNVERAEEEVAA